MVGIDTNVLVRFIVQDDPDQSARAGQSLTTALSPDSPGYVNAIVLCKLVWVLKRAYKYPKPLILAVIEQLLNTRELALEHPDAARSALQSWQKGEADFSDYYLAAINRLAGCSTTITLDLHAGDHPDFTLI